MTDAGGIGTPRHANVADYRLLVDGMDFTALARPRLVSLGLDEKRGGEADQIEIVLEDGDGRLALPRKGALIQVRLGWAQGSDVIVGLIDKGRFTVDEVSWSGPPDQIRITGRSADLTAAFRVPVEQGYVATTLGAIANQVAGRNGLTARVAPTLADIQVAVLAQHQQSDMALLRRLGRDHDAVATVKDRTLILAPIGTGTTATGKALPPLALTRVAGSNYSYREVDRTAEAGTEARYHDADSAERKTVASAGAGSGKRHRLRRVYHSQADAQAAADAHAARNRRAEAEFSLSLALGRPDLYPERPVTLTGFKAEADARAWLIAEVRHDLDKSGLRTSLKLETAAS